MVCRACRVRLRLQRLTSLIVALPKGRSTRPDPSVNAARLIALLPGGASADI